MSSLRRLIEEHPLSVILCVVTATACGAWRLNEQLRVIPRDYTIKDLEGQLSSCKEDKSGLQESSIGSTSHSELPRPVSRWEMRAPYRFVAHVAATTLLPRYQNRQLMLLCRLDDPTIDFFQDSRIQISQFFSILPPDQEIGLDLSDQLVARALQVQHPMLECVVFAIPPDIRVNAVRAPSDVLRLGGEAIQRMGIGLVFQGPSAAVNIKRAGSESEKNDELPIGNKSVGRL